MEKDREKEIKSTLNNPMLNWYGKGEVDVHYLLSTIDSLRDEREGLRKDRDELKERYKSFLERTNGHLDTVDEILDQRDNLQSHLSDLLTTAESIKRRVIDPQLGEDDNWILVKKEELFALAAAVDRVKKEGK